MPLAISQFLRSLHSDPPVSNWGFHASVILFLISFIYHLIPSSHPVPGEVISGPGHKVLICGQLQFSSFLPSTYPARCLGRAQQMFHFGLAMAAGQASNTRDPCFPPSAFPETQRGNFPPARTPLPLLPSILWGELGVGRELGGIEEFVFPQAPKGQRTKPF